MPRRVDPAFLYGVLFGIVFCYGCFKVIYYFLQSRQPLAQADAFDAALAEARAHLALLQERRKYCDSAALGRLEQFARVLDEIERESLPARVEARESPPRNYVELYGSIWQHGFYPRLARDIRRYTERVKETRALREGVPPMNA